MNPSVFSLLVVGLFGGVGISAIAQIDTAGNQPAAEVGSTTQQNAVRATQTNSDNANVDHSTLNADYNTAKAKAQAEYEIAKAKCEPLQGNPMRLCMTDAKTARTEALALAKTQWDNQGETNATDSARSAEGGTK